MLGMQVDRKGRAHEARRIGIRFHAVARLGRHRECERSCDEEQLQSAAGILCMLLRQWPRLY